MFANRFGSRENCVCGLVWVCPTSHRFRPIPLKSVSVSASVVHAVAQVEIRQVYVNSEQNPIEASYIFPLDSNGAVTHFHAELDGRIIKGVVKSSKDAEKDYQTAIRNQQTAFLGEEVKPDVFKLKVGFLKPGAEAKVVIGYVTEVKNDPDSHSIRFVIPTTVAPRYVPSSGHDKKSQDLANMAFSNSPPAPMNIKVVVSIQGEIKTVESLSGHQIIVESKGVIPEQPGDWNKAVVTLVGNVTEMDRDYVMLVTPAEAVMNPRVYYEVLDNGSVAAMAHLIPSFALKEEKVELIIVVDRSGSMMGQSIRMASAALQLFVHSLPADCYFNIVGFGSSHELLFKNGSRKYDQSSLHQADVCAKNLQANLGGTEILQPLHQIYSNSPIPGYLRQIFVITDGEVSNTDEVIGLVKRNSHTSRLFALGIGAASSRHLVQGMATAGGGTCAFVEGDDSIQKATLSQLKNALQPSLTDIKLEWLGLPVQPAVELNPVKTLFGYNKPLNPAESGGAKNEKFLQAPKNIPPIFDGNQMVVFGLFPPKMDKPNGVKIIANSPDGPLNLEIQMNEANHLGKTEMLHKLAVIKLIREMEIEETAMRDSSRRSVQIEIEALGIEHGITSKYTSFISVDDSTQDVMGFGQMQFRQVPSQMVGGMLSALPQQQAQLSTHRRTYACPSSESVSSCSSVGGSIQNQMQPQHYEKGSFNSFFQPQMYFSDQSNASAPPPLPPRSLGNLLLRGGSGDGGGQWLSSGVKKRIRSKEEEAEGEDDNWKGGYDDSLVQDFLSVPASFTSKMERVKEIITQQNFDGSFPLTEKLCGALGISMEDVKAEATKNGWDLSLWTTALTWAGLTTTELKEEKDLWELALNKGEKWMTQNCKDVNILREIRAKAIQIFTNL